MNRSAGGHRGRSAPPVRVPNFEGGIIPEPLLAFGGRHEHVDPKTGIALYGPYTVAGLSKPTPSSIIVGIIGPAAMIADAEQWLVAVKGIITNDGSQPLLFPHYPGFNLDSSFFCDFITGEAWKEAIQQKDLRQALTESTSFEDRVTKVCALYLEAIEILSQRDQRPDVILCCLPQEVIDQCVVKNPANRRVKIERSRESIERRQRLLGRGGQLALFDIDPEDEDDFPQHHNLRRGLKAEAMKFGIPTQLVWPRAIKLIDTPSTGRGRAQDAATRAWNLTTALYHKGGGSPWRLAQVDTGTCYVGVSFYKEVAGDNPQMRTSMAQAFTSAGDGYVLRGSPFEWDVSRGGMSPHLAESSAAELIRGVLDLYKKQNQGSLPSRLVVHKTSRFWDEELAGFVAASEYVPRSDFVALGDRGIQFYRSGEYPAVRGTYIKLSDDDLLLYTSGYIPYLATYPGPRVPRPLEVLEHYGDTPWNAILQEILGLTKMNWNTAAFSMGMPVTIAFSKRVGEILAELPEDMPLRPEYRFYM